MAGQLALHSCILHIARWFAVNLSSKRAALGAVQHCRAQ